jgi:hypothetical protein
MRCARGCRADFLTTACLLRLPPNGTEEVMGVGVSPPFRQIRAKARPFNRAIGLDRRMALRLRVVHTRTPSGVRSGHLKGQSANGDGCLALNCVVLTSLCIIVYDASSSGVPPGQVPRGAPFCQRLLPRCRLVVARRTAPTLHAVCHPSCPAWRVQPERGSQNHAALRPWPPAHY